MSPWVWLTVFLAGVVASLAAHEYGHVAVGRLYGWDYHGVKMTWLGPRALLGHRSRDMREWRLGLVAVAGPCATLLCTVAFVALAQLPVDGNWVFGQLALFNFAVFVFNLLPLPVTDGGHILWHVTGWRPTWKRVGLGWVVLEVLVVLAVLAAHAA